MARRSLEALFERFRTSGDVAALARVFDETAPELLAVARHLARSEAEVKGAVFDLVAMQGIDLELTGSVDTLAGLTPLVGIELPDSPPVDLQVGLRHALVLELASFQQPA